MAVYKQLTRKYLYPNDDKDEVLKLIINKIIDKYKSEMIREGVNNKIVDKVVDDILSKSIIRLSKPDSHYVQLWRHEIIEPGKQGRIIARLMEEEYGISDWETRNEIMNRLREFIHLLNEKYPFVLEHRLPYFDPYPITLLDVKKHIEEM